MLQSPGVSSPSGDMRNQNTAGILVGAVFAILVVGGIVALGLWYLRRKRMSRNQLEVDLSTTAEFVPLENDNEL